MKAICSEAPKVELVNSFSTPYDNAVATARTCYSSKVIKDSDVRKSEKAKLLRDKIASSTYVAGHHTTLQHAHFQFTFENVSRQCLWSFFHAHPFYNSEQVSQRYVPVDTTKFLVPEFSNATLKQKYLECLSAQQNAYHEITHLLHDSCQELYFQVFKGRKKNAHDKKWQNAIKKKCIEVARYVLPIATHTHLYHTVSGLTLHRYHRLAQSFDCPLEQKLIIDEMVNQVNKIDPLFFSKIEDSIDLKETYEYQILQHLAIKEVDSVNAHNFAQNFDQQLEEKSSKLISFPTNAVESLASAVRQVLMLSPKSLSNETALELLLSPQKNSYLGESLNLSSLNKITRALEVVQFSFMKKLSHTADCQAQRHRMLPGIKPIFSRSISFESPDYILPKIFLHKSAEKAKDIYCQTQEKTLETAKYLHKEGACPESIQYIFTNAHPIRFIETGSLADYLHKWTTRLCLNAQEEIWQNSKDEVMEVSAKLPAIGHHILAPCGLRKNAGCSPVCPEGDRFCGVPVWKKTVSEYQRQY